MGDGLKRANEAARATRGLPPRTVHRRSIAGGNLTQCGRGGPTFSAPITDDPAETTCGNCLKVIRSTEMARAARNAPGQIDYKAIATQAVDLLCSIGLLGLHPSQQRRLWQMALDMDRKLNPHRERTVVWTEEEGDIDPPRKESGKPLPVVTLASGNAPVVEFLHPVETGAPWRSAAEADWDGSR